MATSKKKAPEYYKGFDYGFAYGFADADADIKKYGRVFAEVHGLRSASARKRDATPWDKGYAAGYRARYVGGR